jgi:3-hydroxyanthranilate 3,4-dioxygenase
MLPPINLIQWIEENRGLLKPPVGNRQVWLNREFMVTIVGGPNNRTDYHINQGEEFFYQLEGEINLKMVEQGKFIDFPIKAGEIFLLPPRVPHSPQRPANSIGLVIEHVRRLEEKDGFVWFCEACKHKLYEEFLIVTDLIVDLPPVFDRFYSNPKHTTCTCCGREHFKK